MQNAFTEFTRIGNVGFGLQLSDKFRIRSFRSGKLSICFANIKYYSMFNENSTQVGTLSSLRVNVSHNKIFELADNSTGYSLGRSEHGKIGNKFCFVKCITFSD